MLATESIRRSVPAASRDRPCSFISGGKCCCIAMSVLKMTSPSVSAMNCGLLNAADAVPCDWP